MPDIIPQNAAPSFGVSCLHFDWTDIEEAFRRTREEFGLDWLELSTNRVERSQAAQIRRLRREYDLRLGLHGWIDPARLGVETGTTAIRELIDDCAAMAIEILVLHLGSHADRAEGDRIVREQMLAVTADALSAGVRIALENHYEHELGATVAEFRELFDGLDPRAVGFILDYGHANLYPAGADLVDQLGDRLIYSHFADNCGDADTHLAYGLGTVPWQDWLRRTLITGFRGPFVIEFPEKYGLDRFEQCCRDIRTLAAALEESPSNAA